MSKRQFFEQIGDSGVPCGISFPAGGCPERACQVCFAHSGGSHDYHVLSVCDVSAAGKFVYEASVKVPLWKIVNVCDRGVFVAE